MVATAVGAGGAAAIAGAALFFVSDALIGETRFVRPASWGPVAVIITYHLALSRIGVFAGQVTRGIRRGAGVAQGEPFGAPIHST